MKEKAKCLLFFFTSAVAVAVTKVVNFNAFSAGCFDFCTGRCREGACFDDHLFADAACSQDFVDSDAVKVNNKCVSILCDVFCFVFEKEGNQFIQFADVDNKYGRVND